MSSTVSACVEGVGVVCYPSVPLTIPYGDGQKHIDPGAPGAFAQHQNDDVKQIVPGECGGTWAMHRPITEMSKTPAANRQVLR